MLSRSEDLLVKRCDLISTHVLEHLPGHALAHEESELIFVFFMDDAVFVEDGFSHAVDLSVNLLSARLVHQSIWEEHLLLTFVHCFQSVGI